MLRPVQKIVILAMVLAMGGFGFVMTSSNAFAQPRPHMKSKAAAQPSQKQSAPSGAPAGKQTAEPSGKQTPESAQSEPSSKPK